MPAHVPDHEFDGLEGEFLDVEADGWDGVDDFAQLEGVKDGGLACAVQAQHHHFALPFRYLLTEERLEDIAHNYYTTLHTNTSKQPNPSFFNSR